MLSKYLAPTLAAAVLLTGLTALPAQAITATANPTVSPTVEPSATSASSEPVPEPTAEPKTSEPSVAPTAEADQEVPGETVTPTPTPVTPVLKDTKSTGQLQGVSFSLAKRNGLALRGVVSVNPQKPFRDYQIETYDAKTGQWSIYSRGLTDSYGGWYNSLKSTTDDTQILRLVVPEADGVYASYTGPSTVIQRTKDATAVNPSGMPDTVISAPWEQRYFNFKLTKAPDNAQAELQKKVGSKWVKVSSLTTASRTWDYQFKLPLGNKKSANSTIGYRVALSASTYYDAATSKQINVSWENPTKYTGTAKTVYGYTASKCPSVLIRIDANLHKSGAWGRAEITKDPAVIRISTKVPSKYLRDVSLHECSHFIQYATATNKNNAGWTDYKNKANKLLGTTGELGMERINECMTATWGSHSYWTYGASTKFCGQAKVKTFVQNSLLGRKV